MLEARRKRDLGVVIDILGTNGLTQGQMTGLTGISQGRLSEYKNHKYTPEKWAPPTRIETQFSRLRKGDIANSGTPQQAHGPLSVALGGMPRRLAAPGSRA